MADLIFKDFSRKRSKFKYFQACANPVMVVVMIMTVVMIVVVIMTVVMMVVRILMVVMMVVEIVMMIMVKVVVVVILFCLYCCFTTHVNS